MQRECQPPAFGGLADDGVIQQAVGDGTQRTWHVRSLIARPIPAKEKDKPTLIIPDYSWAAALGLGGALLFYAKFAGGPRTDA